MLPAPADGKKLVALLAHLSAEVENVLHSGLTTASQATRETLTAAMQESARYRLLRLGATLRTANEELARFAAGDANFSKRRLTFFLSRAWLLGRGLAQAIESGDEKAYQRLNWSPQAQPLSRTEAACLGVVKRVSPGAFVAFEFRLRSLAEAPPLVVGQRMLWSVVFPIKAGLDIPAEAFLHLPQKQQFLPFLFLERKAISIERAMVAIDEAGLARLSLTETSRIAVGEPQSDWAPHLVWSPHAAIDRLKTYRAGPLDLDTELQEEIVLDQYEIGERVEGDSPGQTVFPIHSRGATFSAIVGADAHDKTLLENLEALRKKAAPRPPLYGLLHYERSRLILQPLTTFADGPEYLTISKENIKKAALLKAISFV